MNSFRSGVTAGSGGDLTPQLRKPTFLLELTVEGFHRMFFHVACLTLNIVKKLKTDFGGTTYKSSFKKETTKKIPTQAPTTHLANKANNT